MTFFLEISTPIQWRPFAYRSAVLVRVGWLWFALGVIRVPFDVFAETAYRWQWSEEER